MPYSPFSPEFIERQRQALVNRRIECRSLLEHLYDPIEDKGDIVDRSEMESLRKSKAETHGRTMKELAEIDAAITKIQRGTYGICESSNQPILIERLIAVPTARYTLESQQRHEKHLQKRDFLKRTEGPERLFDSDD